MIKVIRTDLFRLIRSKAFYVFPIFMALFFISQAFFSESAFQEEQKDGQGRAVTVTDERETDRDLDGTDKKADTQTGNPIKMSTAQFFESLTGEVVLFFVGIVLVIFCTCETRGGFVKNAAGAVADRAYMPISKIIVGIVILIVYIIEYAVLYGITQALFSLFSGRSIEYVHLKQGEVGEFIAYLMVCVLVHIAMIVIMVMVHELTHSRAFGIVFAFALTSGLIEQFMEGAVYLIRHFFGVLMDFDIQKYELLYCMVSGFKSEAYHSNILIIMSVIYTAVFLFLAIFVSRRKEIR